MDTTTLAFVFLGIAVLLLPLAAQSEKHSADDYEEEIRALKQVIADDIETERAMQRVSFNEVLVGIVIGVVLVVILGVTHAIPAIAMIR